MIATGSALIVTGWILVMPGKWKVRAGRITGALSFVGSGLIAAGMLTVVQARN